MKLLKSLIFASLLLISSAHADGFGFNIGPFSLQLNAGFDRYVNEPKNNSLDNPICYAISHNKRLEMVVEGTEKVNPKEIKVVTKRLVIEPYAFAVTRENKPILRGNVIDEKLIKEVTVKYGENQFNEYDQPLSNQEEGFFSGWFSSEKAQNIDIKKISNLRVLEESHFDAPKNYRGLNEKGVRVICQLPFSVND